MEGGSIGVSPLFALFLLFLVVVMCAYWERKDKKKEGVELVQEFLEVVQPISETVWSKKAVIIRYGVVLPILVLIFFIVAKCDGYI